MMRHLTRLLLIMATVTACGGGSGPSTTPDAGQDENNPEAWDAGGEEATSRPLDVSGDGPEAGVCVPNCDPMVHEHECGEDDGCGGICGCPENQECFDEGCWDHDGMGFCVWTCDYFCEQVKCGYWTVGDLYHECDCDWNCDDGNPCTLDTCGQDDWDGFLDEELPGDLCQHEPLDGDPCDDGDSYTVDVCREGECVGLDCFETVDLPGGFGSECTENEECLHEFCGGPAWMSGKRCTCSCEMECPDDLACQQFGEPEDPMYACFPLCGPDCEGSECGDGVCSPDETCDGCEDDCGICAPPCGDAWCKPEDGEDCMNCPGDCGPCCGNGECAGDETCENCPDDCGCAEGDICVDEACCTPDCFAKECGDDGCGTLCGTCPDVAPLCVQGVCHLECQPACEAKECGADGCGGLCGECPGPQDGCLQGLCVCQPACEPWNCGDNGCEGLCECGEDLVCCETVCVESCECIPDCVGMECGDDGCGGSCGECPVGSPCNADPDCGQNMACVENACQPTICVLSGTAGQTVDCSMHLARADQAYSPAVLFQFTLDFDSALASVDAIVACGLLDPPFNLPCSPGGGECDVFGDPSIYCDEKELVCSQCTVWSPHEGDIQLPTDHEFNTCAQPPANCSDGEFDVLVWGFQSDPITDAWLVAGEVQGGQSEFARIRFILKEDIPGGAAVSIDPENFVASDALAQSLKLDVHHSVAPSPEHFVVTGQAD